MRNRNFDVSVTVESDAIGKARVISDTIQAAEILLRRWPAERYCRKHSDAMVACVQAMEGRKPVEAARRAFVAAAKQARIFVRIGRCNYNQGGIPINKALTMRSTYSIGEPSNRVCHLSAISATRRDRANAPGAQPNRLRNAVLKALADS
jgi:hypothetical protein